MYFSRVQLQPEVQRSSQLSQVLTSNSYGLHQLLWDLFPAEEKRSFLFREEIAKEQLKNQRRTKGESLFYIVSRHDPQTETPIFRVESKVYAPVISQGQQFAFKLRANPIVAKKKPGKKNSVRHDVVMNAQRRLLEELASCLGILDVQRQKKSVLRHRILTAWKDGEKRFCSERLREDIRTNERFESLADAHMEPVQLMDWALRAASDFALESWLKDKGVRNGFELVHDEGMNGSKRLQFQAEGYRWHAMPKKGRDAGFSSVDFDGVLQVNNSELFQAMLFNGIGPAKAFGCGLMMVRRM
ncbi:CRISPR processing complex protein CasE [Syntrophotalea carbinolica DSM 2380]|uniref:CRISPR processing complex protein CasE n=1 Tax=Syntrophotalea carbinolica (strain DSM 2380 / NBRC 103641 / GraBd1) TaxID=338963 RepID=Q3A5Z3_SYNC1|nr:type I-E CRISPR-associated protein Cas6/Cse3/CasE [Syntrophotalea carbinolica]ABA88214.1 CRISPR processing complex protein CasE [Syntrophotalea carbinolica DSM 2380]